MAVQYEGDYMIRRGGRWLIWLACGAVLLIGVVMWAGPHSGTLQERARDVTGASGRVADMPDGDGTSGVDPSAAPALGAATNPVIHELDTITGALDGHELVGQRVDLHVDLATNPSMMGNGTRFWIGPRDNRVLVVLRRDTRDDLQRTDGDPSHHGLPPLETGRRYAISGTVQRLPRAEAMASWELTQEEQEVLAQRPIYVAATQAVPE
jgi:hypothetical protein